MATRGEALRRRYGLEVGLGVAVALTSIWLVLSPDGRTRGVEKKAQAALVEGETLVAEELLAATPAVAPTPARAEVTPESGRSDPPPARPGTTPARKGTRRGSGTIDIGEVGEPIFVLVLDAVGVPAPRVPVRLSRGDRPMPSQQRGFTFGTGLTDGEGRVTLHFRDDPRPDSASQPEHIWVEVELQLPDAPALDLGPQPSSQLVTLQLPATGRLLVHVLDDEGRPQASGALVKVTGRDFPVRDGLVEVPWVPLDVPLEVSARLEGVLGGEAHVTVQGPVRPGQTVEATIQLGSPWPTVGFRLVDAAGEPVNASLRVTVHLEPLSPQHLTLGSDSQGVVSFLLYSHRLSDTPRTIEVETVEPRPRRATVALPFELGAGPNALGEVILR